MKHEDASSSKRPHAPAHLRVFYRVLGVTLVPIGIVGVILPILPGVPVLILAAACFARSSPKFEHWLISHPTFGPGIVAWRERGAISLRSKILAISMMGISVLVIMRSAAPTLVQIGVICAIASAILFVSTRPNE